MPLRPRQGLKREKAQENFAKFKVQAYPEPNSRGGGTNNIRSIAWNPLSTLVATGSSDRTLRVWNPDKPNPKFSTELKGHAASVEKVAFNPIKDSELCSVSIDGVVKFWDVRSKTCVNEIKGLGEAFTLAWAPDGSTLVVGNKADNIFILSPTQPTPISSHQQSRQTNQIAFCWSGERVFLTQGDGRVRILSYPDFQPIVTLPFDDESEFMLNGHASACLVAELQPTGRFLATGGSDSIIAMWDTTEWICKHTLTSLVGAVRSISFTFDGMYLVGGSDDGSGIEIRHTEKTDIMHTIKTVGPTPIVAWAPTRYVLAYSDLGTLKITGLDDRK